MLKAATAYVACAYTGTSNDCVGNIGREGRKRATSLIRLREGSGLTVAVPMGWGESKDRESRTSIEMVASGWLWVNHCWGSTVEATHVPSVGEVVHVTCMC